MNTKVTVLSALFALGLANTSAGQVLITNGSFENGPMYRAAPGYVTLDVGSLDVVGWVVTRDRIRYANTYYLPASDGERLIELSGHPGAGGIAQAFATVPGQTYRVSFDMSGNDLGAQNAWAMRVLIDDEEQYQDFYYQVTEGIAAGNPWYRKTWEFQAVEFVTRLEFHALAPYSGHRAAYFHGPTLDNVEVINTSCGIVERYCTSVPNASGKPARIDFMGSSSVARAQATIVASQCPNGVYGFFIMGQDAVQYPYGTGYLCINPYTSFYRMLPVGLTDHAGACPRMIDFATMPAGIQPGDTWHFQFLFRDTSGPAAGFNSSDAVRVTFC